MRSNSARCASVKNSWFANFGERWNGVSVSSVQMPCRSGSPHGVFSVVAKFPPDVAPAPDVAGAWADAVQTGTATAAKNESVDTIAADTSIDF